MYQHGRRVNRPHNYRIFLATLAIIGVVVLGAWYMIHRDIASSTEPKSNVPIVSTVGTQDGGMITIDEPLFSFQLPDDWKLAGETHESYANFYQWHGTKKGGNDRTLTIHVDIMPPDYKLVKLQPLTVNGPGFTLGPLSDDCVNFSGEINRKSIEPFPAKWQDVQFTCDPIRANQTIGTGSKGNSIGTSVSGAKGIHSYFFYYDDRNVRPDSVIFRDMLASFKVK